MNTNIYNTSVSALKTEKVEACIFLMNGIKLVGFVEAYDDISVLLMGYLKGKPQHPQLIMRQAISTIEPNK